MHRLLKGSVNHAIQIEKKYKNTLPWVSLDNLADIFAGE